MRPDYTPTESSLELLHAIGRILFTQVNGGDVGQLLAGMEVDLLQQLQVHVLSYDRSMRDWLERMGLPKLEAADCFWSGLILPQILKELDQRSLENQI